MKHTPFALFLLAAATASLVSACNERGDYEAEHPAVIQCSGKYFEICNGVCTDLRHDRNHCGSCTTVCNATQMCEIGSCIVPTPTPKPTCSSLGLNDCNGSCVNIYRDQNHCGRCGNVCLDDEICKAGDCVSTAFCTSNVNCGDKQICKDSACVDVECNADSHCSGGASCVNHVCQKIDVCAEQGLTECSGQCVDTNSDIQHCGSCDNVCLANELCIDKHCIPQLVPACSTNMDCGDKQICKESACVDVECTENAHCTGGKVCDKRALYRKCLHGRRMYRK